MLFRSHFPVAIGINERFLDRFLGKFVQLALIEIVALRKAEKFLSAIMPFCSAFNSRHCLAPLLSVGPYAYGSILRIFGVSAGSAIVALLNFLFRPAAFLVRI